MIEKKDIEKLAKLSRIKLSEPEIESLQKDVESILLYVNQINEVSVKEENTLPLNRNVLREDENPHESTIYTEEILSKAPSIETGFIKVKNIL